MLPNVLGLKAAAIACAVSLAIGSAATWRVLSWRDGARETKAAVATVRQVRAASVINVRLGELVIPRLAFEQTETQRRQTEIPRHVTPEIDRTHPVPLGFVRMWNDAAHGPIPGPAAGGDADPSGVPLSDVARAHTADQGTLDVCRTSLAAWWAWYDQHVAAWNKATGN